MQGVYVSLKDDASRVLTIPKRELKKKCEFNLRQRGYSWSVCMYSVKDALCICTV